MSQVANTYWVDAPASTTATTRIRVLARRRTRVRRSLDAVVCAVILASTGLCVSVYIRSHAEFAAAISRQQAAMGRVAELKRANEKIASEIEQLKNDPRMIEALARERLGFVRPGEMVIRLPQEDPGTLRMLRIRADGPAVNRADPRNRGNGTVSLTRQNAGVYTQRSD